MDMVSGNPVVAHESQDDVAYTVITCFADEVDRNSCPAQRYDTVEHRSTGYSCRGLSVAENNVEYGFSYAYNFSHTSLSFLRYANICNFP